ncbi:LlaJI family restriction endonuclease [Novacetimonas hansenii]|uniref:LlaJI family restriction endonuclease n=1 Tax=Novacetimonas hansenii TaxID=436 RepID=UPI000B28A874|nr:LlaJI family restriction endonuclease [Novacetimonas hansenii]
MPNEPRVLQDRVAVQHLEERYQKLTSELRRQDQGKTLQKETVHFCGLACTSSSESYVFVPRKTLVDSTTENQRIAKTTMRVLAKYGQDTRDRQGFSSAEDGNVGLISTIQDLADDFRRYGIFAERVRYATKNSGKANWPRTAARELVIVSANGNIVYPNIRTSRTSTAHESILARVQVAVLLEIAQHHGWWLDGLQGREAELKAYNTSPDFPRFLWSQKLRSLLPNLFAQRAIRLAYYLISYLDEDPRQNDGITLYGIDDFHSVWERMLREVLPGVEGGWNSRLPKPAFRQATNGHLQVQERGMQTDIIIRDGTTLKVLDAKYYDATFLSNSPGWPDIVKQLFYHLALSSVVGDKARTGSFVFPAQNHGEGPFTQVSVVRADLEPADGFPRINCIYLSVIEVMEAYLGRRKLQVEIP